MASTKKRPIHRCQCASCRQRPRSAIAKEHRAINRVLAGLDEKNRRRFVGMLALQWGRGGIAQLFEITGLSRVTLRRGQTEVKRVEPRAVRDRVRRAGAGRRAIEKNTRQC
jgi:hypothetical protein